MKKITMFFCFIIVTSNVLTGCTPRKCRCGSSDVEYEGIFAPTFTTYYFCKECYMKIMDDDNLTTDGLWNFKSI